MSWIIRLAVINVIFASAVPAEKPEDKAVVDLDLGDSPVGSRDFDHESFLGKFSAHEYDSKSPKENARILSKIFDKIDKNKDGRIDHADMAAWIKKMERRGSLFVAMRHIYEHFKTNPSRVLVTFKDHEKMTWGHLTEEEKEMTDSANNYKTHYKRDKRLWAAADRNGDGKLTLEEYTDFLHPAESAAVSKVVVEETLENIDKDNDGLITFKEYFDNMYPDKSLVQDSWEATERESFAKDDLNGDGYLDRGEIRKWILPGDHTVAVEASHLISEADSNKDGVLSKEEMLAHPEFFIGSSVTRFGEIMRNHKEL